MKSPSIAPSTSCISVMPIGGGTACAVLFPHAKVRSPHPPFELAAPSRLMAHDAGRAGWELARPMIGAMVTPCLCCAVLCCACCVCITRVGEWDVCMNECDTTGLLWEGSYSSAGGLFLSQYSYVCMCAGAYVYGCFTRRSRFVLDKYLASLGGCLSVSCRVVLCFTFTAPTP
jgi:hypothetical protein